MLKRIKVYRKMVLLLTAIFAFVAIFSGMGPQKTAKALDAGLYTENFSGSDGSQPLYWKKILGNLNVGTNEYKTTEANIDTYSIYNPPEYPQWKNIAVTADIQLNGGNSTSGVAVRSDSTGSNYYYARIIVGNPGKIEIVKISNNAASIIKSEETANLALGTWYTLQFYAYNETLKAIVTPRSQPDRILGTCQVEDKSISDAGTIGLKARQGNTSFDNLSVSSLNAPPENLTLLNTDFTGNNGSTPKDWTVRAGTVSILSNQYYADTTADTVAVYTYSPAMKWKNLSVTVDVMPTSAASLAGPIFRANAATDTYYHVRIQAGNPGAVQILKITPGGTSVLKTENITIAANTYYTLKTDILGDRIVTCLYKTDAPDIPMTILDLRNSEIPASGNVAATVGVKSKNGAAYFDNFVVREINRIPDTFSFTKQEFSGANSTQPVSWRQLYGTIGIEGDAYQTNVSTDTMGQFYPAQFPKWSDVSLCSDIQLTSSSASSGIAFRMNAAGTDYYGAQISASTGRLEIYKVIARNTVVLQSIEIKSLAVNQWYTLQVFAKGSRIKAQVYEKEYAPVVLGTAEVNDSSITVGGTVGLKARQGNTTFDNFGADYLAIYPEEVILDQGDSTSGWSTPISGGTADSLSLTADPGKSVYSGNSFKLHFSAVNASNSSSPAIISIAKDLSLPSGSKRVGFYLNTRDASVSSLSIEVADSTGEVFKYPVYNVSGTPWDYKEVLLDTLWDSTRHSGGNNDGVPDGDLTFKKINIAVNPIFTNGAQVPQDIYVDELGAGTYVVSNPPTQVNRIKDVDLSVRHQGGFSGFKTHFYQDDTLPYIPLGHILPRENNNYRISYTIERDTKLVDWGDVEVAGYDPAVDDRRKLYFNLTEEANYFVYFRIKNSNGVVIASDVLFSVQVTHGKAPTEAVDRSDAYYSQNIALARLNPGRSNIYQNNEPVDVSVELYKPSTGNYTAYEWEYEISSYVDLVPIKTLKESVDFGTGAAIQKQIAFNPPVKGAYFITMRLYGDGNIIEQKQKSFGIKPEAYDRNFVTEGITSYETLTTQKLDVYNLSEVRPFGNPHNDYFKSYVDKAAETGTSIDMIIYWNDLEPLQGVYQYDYIQERLDYAASKGVKVILGVWTHLDHLPLWLWYDDMLDQDYKGRQYSTTYLRNYTRSSQRVRDAYKDMIGNVIQKFRNNPNIIGWNFSEGVESWYSDRTTFGYVTDYSRFTRDEFADYLQNTKGYTLADVNARYGTSYSNWGEVALPRPDWDVNPDLSKYWVDFQEFKIDKVKSWYDEYMTYLRQYDNVRAIFQFGIIGNGPIEKFASVFRKHRCIITHGGSDHILEQMYEGFIVKEGLYERPEPAATPPKKSQITDSIFNGSPYGSYLGLNYQMVRNWQSIVDNQDQDYYESIDYLSWIKEVMTDSTNDLRNSEKRDSKLGAYFSYDSLIYGTKSLNWLDWGSDVVNKLYFFNDVEHLYPSILSDYTGTVSVQDQRMILDTGSEILSQQAMDKLKQYVGTGGKLVLFADSGKYNKDTGLDDRYLLTQLGLNVGSWTNKGTGLAAAVLEGNGVINKSILPSLSLSTQYYVNPVVAGNYTTLAQYSNGYPAAIRWNYGSGQVLLFLGKLNWTTPSSNKGLLDALQDWGGFIRHSDSTNSKVRLVTREKGKDIYAIAYYRPWNSTANYSQTEMNSLFASTSAVLKFSALEYDMYQVSEVGDTGNIPVGTYTKAQLNAGIDQSFSPGQLRIFKIAPLIPAP